MRPETVTYRWSCLVFSSRRMIKICEGWIFKAAIGWKKWAFKTKRNSACWELVQWGFRPISNHTFQVEAHPGSLAPPRPQLHKLPISISLVVLDAPPGPSRHTSSCSQGSSSFLFSSRPYQILVLLFGSWVPCFLGSSRTPGFLDDPEAVPWTSARFSSLLFGFPSPPSFLLTFYNISHSSFLWSTTETGTKAKCRLAGWTSVIGYFSLKNEYQHLSQRSFGL